MAEIVFSRLWFSLVQSDYWDTCDELKKKFDSRRRSRKNLCGCGNAIIISIQAEYVLIDSYDAELRKHRALAAKELKEQNIRIENASYFYNTQIVLRSQSLAVNSTIRNELENEPNAESFVSIDFQMGKLLSHWGVSAQPGKTYNSQSIMQHMFCLVDSSNSWKYIYIMGQTTADEKDSDHHFYYLFDNTERMVQTIARFLRTYMDAAPYFKDKFLA